MKNIFIGIFLASVVCLQGCQTTHVGICKVCHAEEAAQAEAAAAPTEKNPFKRADAWMQENMW